MGLGTEEEDLGTAAGCADQLEPSPDPGRALTHSDQTVAFATAIGDAGSGVADLDEERLRGKVQHDAAGIRTGMPPHIAQRFANHLEDDFALVLSEIVLTTQSLDLDLDAVALGVLLPQCREVAHQSTRTDLVGSRRARGRQRPSRESEVASADRLLEPFLDRLVRYDW